MCNIQYTHVSTYAYGVYTNIMYIQIHEGKIVFSFLSLCTFVYVC